jgi:tetrahydromethanopterin S-methyltransferase subunit G
MKKQKRKFVLAEASLDEINKQLKINTLVIIILVVMLMLNATQFMRDYSLLYGALIAIMLFLLFVMAKSRTLLTMQKQTLIR